MQKTVHRQSRHDIHGQPCKATRLDLSIVLLTSNPQGISSTRLAEYLEITQKSAWFVLRRIRYALEYEVEDSPAAARKRTESYHVDMSFDEAMDKIITVPAPKSL